MCPEREIDIIRSESVQIESNQITQKLIFDTLSYNKTLHLTEILTLLKSTFNQQKNQVERLFRFLKTTARILRPTLSNVFATPSENHIVSEFIMS